MNEELIRLLTPKLIEYNAEFMHNGRKVIISVYAQNKEIAAGMIRKEFTNATDVNVFPKNGGAK